MEMYQICSYTVLLALCLMGTTGAPSVSLRHLAANERTNHRDDSMSVPVADSYYGDPTDDESEDGEDEEEDCHVRLTPIMINCLEGFEVQLAVFRKTPNTSEDAKWRELTELCRQHDYTLLCISQAFSVCPPTSKELQLMTHRIAYLRSYLLEECPIARSRTTTPTTTTTTTTRATPPRPTTTQQHIPPDHWPPSDNRPVAVDAANRGPLYTYEEVSTKRPADTIKYQVQGHDIDIDVESDLDRHQGHERTDSDRHSITDNDVHSRINDEDIVMEDSAAPLCADGEASVECLIRAITGSASLIRSYCWLHLVLFSLTILCIRT